MVEKYYCDVCGEETENDKIIDIDNEQYDVCDKCLTEKTLVQILVKLDHTACEVKFWPSPKVQRVMKSMNEKEG